MELFAALRGVYAAAVTPLKANHSPDLEAIPTFLSFLAQRGCHGALLLGTTGEGPSFSTQERLEILRAALPIRQVHPGFHLLAGTGTPSLEETIHLTRAAFNLGMEGVVVLPPYYYRRISDEGLYEWFRAILLRSVPEGRALFVYHIPPLTGITFSFDLLSRLKEAFPSRFAGIKDSSGEAEFADKIGLRFGGDLLVLNGNDRLFSQALTAGASGCITALANLYSPDLRLVWEGFCRGEEDVAAQTRLDLRRAAMEKYPPFPPLIKALLPRFHPLPAWQTRPPLLPVSTEVVDKVLQELELLEKAHLPPLPA